MADDPYFHDFPDRAIRDLLRHPANLRDLLATVVPELEPRLDCERAEPVDRELPLQSWERHELDLLFRIPFREEGSTPAALVCVLIEHQSQPDPAMPIRMLVYSVLYWRLQWQAWERQHGSGEPLRLTPVVPIVFHTGPYRWRSNRQLSDLFPDPPVVANQAPVWPLLFWDLAEQDPRALLDSTRALMQSLAVVRMERADSEEFLRLYAEVQARVSPLGLSDRVRWKELIRFLVSWIYNRRRSGEQSELLRLTVEAQDDVMRRTEVRDMAETTYKTIAQAAGEELAPAIAERLAQPLAVKMAEKMAQPLAERLAQPLAERLAQPLAERLAQPLAERLAQPLAEQMAGQMASALALQDSRETLRSFLEDRFGQVAPELIRRIEECTDTGKLKLAARRVLRIATPEQIDL